MKRREFVCPKADWGPGLWQLEPDELSFQASGFDCRLLRGSMGSWCGYVHLPTGCGLARGYESWPISELKVHGGVTFSGEPNHEGVPWAVGFDCAHAGDVMPAERAYMDSLRKATGAAPTLPWCYGAYRTLEYAQEETASLAKQLRRWDRSLTKAYGASYGWVLNYLNAGNYVLPRQRRRALRGKDVAACEAVYRLSGVDALDRYLEVI